MKILHSLSQLITMTNYTVLRMLSWGVLAGTAAVLLTCTSGISVTYTPPAASESVIDYHRKIANLTDAELAEEIGLKQTEYDASGDALRAVQLAMALSSREATNGASLEHAIELLQRAFAISQATPMANDDRVYAEQRLELLRSRQQLLELNNLLQQTRESLSQMQVAYSQLDERYLGLARILASLEQQNTLLAEQNKLMQQQLEALTVIEQQLADREQLQGQP